MGWITGRHDLESRRIQRIFGDVFLHADFSPRFGGAALKFAPHTLIPNVITGVILYRPKSDREEAEALVVVYDEPGMFYVKSQVYDVKAEADSSLNPDPLIVSRVLHTAQRIWMERWMQEREVAKQSKGNDPEATT